MNQIPHAGTLITVFGLYPGNVIKGPAPTGQVLVEYKMPTCRVRGTVALSDVELRIKPPPAAGFTYETNGLPNQTARPVDFYKPNSKQENLL
jgi:hypothetical protein